MQLDDIIRYGMKPEYMFCLLINLIISRIIPISIKSVPYNFKSNWSTLRVCIENCVSFYAHQRALRFIIQPNPCNISLAFESSFSSSGKNTNSYCRYMP